VDGEERRNIYSGLTPKTSAALRVKGMAEMSRVKRREERYMKRESVVHKDILELP
jgi:hypothetical protein